MRDLKSLPKAHLHLHLEGAMRRSTLAELCQRYGIEEPPDTRWQTFDDFGHFVGTYWAACECIRTRDDLARLIHEVAEDAAKHGALWIEPAYDGERFSTLRTEHRLFDDQRESWLFVLEQAAAAERATGVGIGFMSAVDRIASLESAHQRAAVTIALVQNDEHLIESDLTSVDGSHRGITAFGLHGNEQGFPPEPFAEAFRQVREQTDLLLTPHAGEIAPFPNGGPTSVRGAVDVLQADRVLHGVLAIEDPELVDYLGKKKICLDVCPSSNVALKVFDSVSAHPLPKLLAAGVPCTVGSDDPLLFGPDLLDEFELCRQDMGLDDAQLADLARASFSYAGAP